MDKHEALKWFRDRRDMMLQEKQAKAEDIAIKCIEESMNWEWISVETKLPETPKNCRFDDGTWLGYFLVLHKKGYKLLAPYNFVLKKWIFFDQDITHWMPLPDLSEIKKLVVCNQIKGPGNTDLGHIIRHYFLLYAHGRPALSRLECGY